MSQSILDALLAQYVTPYGGGAQPQMSAVQPPGGPQMSPVQGGQAPMQTGAPIPAEQEIAEAMMGAQDNQLQASMPSGPMQATQAQEAEMALEAGAQPFMDKYSKTQEQRFDSGIMGVGEMIFDMAREKKMRPQAQALAEAKGRMAFNTAQEKQQNRIKTRAKALEELGNTPEEAYAIASTTGADEKFDISKYDQREEPLVEERNRSARAVFLKENPDLVARLGEKGADQFWTEGNVDRGGTSLTMLPDGTVMFSDGGDQTVMPLTTGAKSQVQKALLDTEGSKRALERIQKNAKNSFLTTSGRWTANLGNFLDRTGWSDNKIAQYGAERSAWSNEIAQEVMQFRKEITGVAGGPAEMSKIEAMFANPDMGPEQFKENMEMLVNKYQDEANARRFELEIEPYNYPEYEFEFGGDKEQLTDEELEAMYR